MKINIILETGKIPIILAVIEVSNLELSKHKCQRLALILNKITDYILCNAKRDKIILNYLNNLDHIYYVTDNNIRIDLIN
jgi:hypothetical protein